MSPKGKRPERLPAVDCICGATIRPTPLPPDLAKLSGHTFIWVHDHGDIYCYPDDQQATATPAI